DYYCQSADGNFNPLF
nr:immunoglobulin light chain junction region [Macaca mulatta]MOW30982.1 immunoglobulin light chain junction region [Macaca mulatta]MOW31030.1 immunoglobulin light chain junction region [Macaca mulatta]MOW31036.1 immunoglobulin light chain junction region [Macaca mulatta]MOW31047.1 immunoglobulin light chain junction region [Macaca mulatta]